MTTLIRHDPPQTKLAIMSDYRSNGPSSARGRCLHPHAIRALRYETVHTTFTHGSLPLTHTHTHTHTHTPSLPPALIPPCSLRRRRTPPAEARGAERGHWASASASAPLWTAADRLGSDRPRRGRACTGPGSAFERDACGDVLCCGVWCCCGSQ